MLTENKSLTISQLNELIQGVLNMGFPNALWICGEIQGFDRNKDKRHVFFELVEKDALSEEIIARIGLVIFSGRKTYISDVLKSAENAFQLKDDIEVKFLCKIDFYPPHGAVRLVVESIDPVYTLGKIAQQKQKLIASLRQSGVLDKNKQIPLADVPLNIGLITAYDSAAYNDFLHELKVSQYGFRVFYKNAVMQGKQTEREVCQAIDVLNTLEKLDAIVITRGGGSIADLSCFDSEMIALKIAESRLPVLSGIGHEINITVTDLAAHTYQKTPTAIAKFLVERIGAFLLKIEQQGDAVISFAKNKLNDEKKKLKESAFQLQNRTHHYLKVHNQQLIRVCEILKRQPQQLLRDNARMLTEQKLNLSKTITVYARRCWEKVQQCERMIEIVHPLNTIKRGFSITRAQNGKILRSVSEVQLETILSTQLGDGIIISEVSAVKKEDNRAGSEIQQSR